MAGDLFECAEDLEDPSLWQESSENPELQQQNRMSILRYVDVIIPGHGSLFKVPSEYKNQMKMVMVLEECEIITTPDSVQSTCVIFEVDD